ncbi:dihydrodipicolinate synthase family protein [Terriglobus aquaticus]|uniref:Dihydrodipicolinate synthase family protein n=1 Tax=Terriglobus aquaticus TaxID=940139 RepID=A0ABW9KMY0_9BACT|nr:dihydrodipicolinate synthase family protein [Terriglobus aquaticus]
MLLDGVHVPLTTPFYPDGRVYARKLEHNVRRYSLTPVAGLIVLGEGSEVLSLGLAEQREILRTVADTAAPEKVLTATLNQGGCHPALIMAEHAANMQYDLLLLAPPPQWANDIPALSTWFRVIADGAPLPCLLASRCGGSALPIDLLADLAAHPNVLGVLEQSQHISRVADLRDATSSVRRSVTTTITFTAATRRMLRPPQAELSASASGFVSAAALSAGSATATSTAAILEAPAVPQLRTRTKQVGSQILWAHAVDSTEALRAGAAGIATPVAASIPQAVFEIWAAWKDGDTSLMREKQGRVAAIEPTLLAGGPALVKSGAELSGYFGGRPRLPLVAPTAEAQQELAAALHGMRS